MLYIILPSLVLFGLIAFGIYKHNQLKSEPFKYEKRELITINMNDHHNVLWTEYYGDGKSYIRGYLNRDVVVFYNRFIIYCTYSELRIAYVVDNWNTETLGCVDTKYVKCGGSFTLYCKNGKSIEEMINHGIPTSVSYNHTLRGVDCTSLGAALYNEGEIRVRRGYLDGKLYGLINNKYVLIDEKAIDRSIPLHY